jgi:mannose-6-phosphate isomerase-like protein (cupin superfamily)
VLEKLNYKRSGVIDYHEYYVVLDGNGSLEVDGSMVPWQAGATVMI